MAIDNQLVFFVLTWVLMKKGGSDTGGIKCNVSEWNVQTALVNSCVNTFIAFSSFFPSYCET